VLDLAANAYFGAGATTDPAKFTDQLHPTAAAQAFMAGLYQAAIDPMLRAAPRVVTATETLVLSGASWAAGKFGRGLASGGYGFVPVSVWPVVPPPTFTVEAWLKTSAATFGVAIGQVVGAGGSSPFSWYFGVLSDGRAVASTENSAAGNIITAQVVNDGQPHHFRFVVKPGGGDLYVDGVLRGSSTVGIMTPTRGLSIQRLDNMGFAFDGVTDSIALFSGDQSALPVPTGPYAAGMAGLMGYFPMDGHGVGWR
jgi:Concanavalin A-like lectin/glucanases superfamily